MHYLGIFWLALQSWQFCNSAFASFSHVLAHFAFMARLSPLAANLGDGLQWVVPTSHMEIQGPTTYG
jgi:hypothetical protein